MLRQGLGRNRCGSRRPLYGVDLPIMPSFEPRFSINMETPLPGQVTTVDQDSPARQIGCGENGESRTISAAFPPRSGFVQQAHQYGRQKAPLVPRSAFPRRLWATLDLTSVTLNVSPAIPDATRRNEDANGIANENRRRYIARSCPD